MEIQHQGRRVRTQTIALVLAALLALALALAVSRLVVSNGTGGSQPSTGAGRTTTTSGPADVLAPDAKDRNDQLSQPIDYGGPCWQCVGGPPESPQPAGDGRRLPH
jgi:hypothetical protein